MAKALRVPKYEDLPPGPLARERLDPLLISRGLISAEQLKPRENPWDLPPEERWVPTLGDKLKLESRGVDFFYRVVGICPRLVL